jgi:hypothetical protein
LNVTISGGLNDVNLALLSLNVKDESLGTSTIQVTAMDSLGGIASPAVGTLVVTGATCFVEGTRILTPKGEVPVEDLKPGDIVVTLRDGRRKHRPVVWIGRRRIDVTRHRDPDAVRPIRFLPDALADGVPNRELRVSPAHAMVVDNQFIPARLLLNGATILRDDRESTITYLHIETEQHSVLLAENAPTESYLDTGNRGTFENGSAPLILHPDLAEVDAQRRRESESCLPFTSSAAVVEPLWRRLADRAAALGHFIPKPALISDPDPRVIVAGRTLRPFWSGHDRYLFVLPAGCAAIQLVSRASSPSDVMPWIEDRRRLGLSVRRIQLREKNTVTDMALDHPNLVQGWWDVECHGQQIVRWTDGEAFLQIGDGGVRVLEIAAKGLVAYVDEPDAADAIAGNQQRYRA